MVFVNEEIWKDIKGYYGLYKVSNFGRVKSYKFNREKILKLNFSNDYLRVNLSKNRIGTKLKIHRLVAETFLDNSKNLPVVGHKNDNKLDNHINNLYWTDHKENLTHNGIHLRRQKPIIAVNETTILFFKSATEANNKGFKRQCIVSCLSKKQKRYKSFAWFRI